MQLHTELHRIVSILFRCACALNNACWHRSQTSPQLLDATPLCLTRSVGEMNRKSATQASVTEPEPKSRCFRMMHLSFKVIMFLSKRLDLLSMLVQTELLLHISLK